MALRKGLAVATFSIILLGLVAIGGVFVYSLAPSKAIEGTYTVDLNNMLPGSIKKLEFQKYPFWVLRRTDKMISVQGSIDENIIGWQPYWAMAKNEVLEESPYRSYDPEFFVFYPQAGIRDCEVRFTDQRPEEVDNANWSAGFIDPCSSRVFDTAGRIYAFHWGWHLYIPNHEWVSKGVLRLGT